MPAKLEIECLGFVSL